MVFIKNINKILQNVKKEPASTNMGGIVMAENNTLGNTGIEVIEPLQDEKVIDIVNQVSTRIMTAFPESNLSYLDIFKTLLDTPMYYAKIPKGLSKANYYYKDSSIYFSNTANLEEVDEYIFHEFIHRLQERKDKKGKITRLGVCEVNELSVKGTALNEAAIQYVTTKAYNNSKKIVNIYNMSIPSRTEYYPIITNIISQLAFLLGEKVLIDSTINGNEEFKIDIIDNVGENEYNTIEKNLNEILRLKNEIAYIQKSNQLIDRWQLRNNNIKINENIKLIRRIYFDTQNILFMSYFHKILKRTENDIEVDMIRKKLHDYGNLTGIAEDYDSFNLYCIEFEKKAEQRIEELKNKKALIVLKDNFVYRIIRKIKRLLKRSEKES